MTPSELADFIINIYDDIKKMDGDLIPHTAQGGLHRLMLENIDDWNMYKIWCMWTSKDITDPEATKEYIKITDNIQEGIDVLKERSKNRIESN